MTAHICGPSCGHGGGLPVEGSGLKANETQRVSESGGGVLEERPESRPFDGVLCEDCGGLWEEHTGAGVGGKGPTNPWLACRGFVPEGPKS